MVLSRLKKTRSHYCDVTFRDPIREYHKGESQKKSMVFLIDLADQIQE